MYTGIVQEIGRVGKIDKVENGQKLEISVSGEFLKNLSCGDSIALNGVCHTVVGLLDAGVRVDSGFETLKITTMGSLQAGGAVNLERSARFGQEIGGHAVSGHVDGAAEIVEISIAENLRIVRVSVPQHLKRYIFNKGFICLHGASLTVNDLDLEAGTFEVCLIPETLAKTNLGSFSVKDKLNLEIDRMGQVMVDTIERTLAAVYSNPQKK